MLVLTRKPNQSIMIGDDVEVSVLSVMGEKVRIGIQAPQEIPVFRKEIYLEIHRDDGNVQDNVPAEVDPLGELEESAEHDHCHDHGGQDQREHQQHEAREAPSLTAVDFAFERALLGSALQRRAAAAVERDLLDELALPLGQALAHLHRRGASGAARRQRAPFPLRPRRP